MDPMLRVGLMSKPEKVVSIAINYLGITDLEGQAGDMAAAKRLCVLMLQDAIRPRMKMKDIVSELNMTPTIYQYTNKVYRRNYEGDIKIYSYIYQNVKNKIEGKFYYSMNDLYSRCVQRFPITEDLLFYPAKPFILYFVKNGVSKKEISRFLKLPNYLEDHIQEIELENKNDYFSIIDSTIDEMLNEIHKPNKTP